MCIQIAAKRLKATHPYHFWGEFLISWFYDRGAIKDQAHTGTSKGLSQAINRALIRKSLPNYANVNATIHSHGLSAGTHCATSNDIRKGLAPSKRLVLRMSFV